jgi:glycosyltransferase involved in cell wall biosynthesis
LLFIVPCFNEQGSVRGVVEELRAVCPAGDVLVVDDGSRDQTAEVVKSLALVIRLPVNLGIGGAMQTGFRFAREHRYQFCMQVDGDGQHPPAEALKFIAAYQETPSSLLIGSRFLRQEGAFRSTASRRAGIAVIRWLVRQITGTRISDPTSGFRLFDRRAIEAFSEDYSLDYPEPISLAIANEWGLTMREIPVRMREREHGRSSISGVKNLAYMVRVCSYLAAVRLRRVF